jgi:hypothetical protein
VAAEERWLWEYCLSVALGCVFFFFFLVFNSLVVGVFRLYFYLFFGFKKLGSECFHV